MESSGECPIILLCHIMMNRFVTSSKFLIVMDDDYCYVGFQALIQYETRQSAVIARGALQVVLRLHELHALILILFFLDDDDFVFGTFVGTQCL